MKKAKTQTRKVYVITGAGGGGARVSFSNAAGYPTAGTRKSDGTGGATPRWQRQWEWRRERRRAHSVAIAIASAITIAEQLAEPLPAPFPASQHLAFAQAIPRVHDLALRSNDLRLGERHWQDRRMRGQP